MDERSILREQLENLEFQLLQVEKAVLSERLDVYLRARVSTRFDKLITQKRNQILKLEEQVNQNQPLQACWSQFHTLELETRNLFDECLAFIQGALARADAVDDGMCLLADQLLDDLAFWSDVRWRRFTLLASGEFYKDIAEVIRIRFPEVSIWGLPILAHEFGHYLGPELRENSNDGYEYPFQQMLKQADENRPVNWPLPHAIEWHFIHEHFADLFATYSLGPAFACSFILLRLNPITAFQESPTHPSHAKRAHAIFWMLERMDQAESVLIQPYRWLINLLQGVWQKSLQAAGQVIALPPAEISLLNSRLEELLDLITRTTPSQLGFKLVDWQRAQLIANGLLAETWKVTHQNINELTRRDVVNAAWLSRLQISQPNSYHVNIKDIGNRALEIYRKIPPREA